MANEYRVSVPSALSRHWEEKAPGPSPWDFWAVYEPLKALVANPTQENLAAAQQVVDKYEQIIKEHSKK